MDFYINIANLNRLLKKAYLSFILFFIMFILIAPVKAAVRDYYKKPDKVVYTIVELDVNNIVVNNSAVVYTLNNELFFSINALSTSLEFPIVVNATAGTANGWFINSDKKFNLDLSKNTFSANGKKIDINTNNVFIINNEIYMSKSLLEQVIPIKFEYFEADSIINITSTEKLPIELELEAQARRDKLQTDNNQPKDWTGIPFKTSDDIFSIPFLNTRFSYTTARARDSESSQYGYSIRGSNRILGMDAEYLLDGSISNSKINNINIPTTPGSNKSQETIENTDYYNDFNIILQKYSPNNDVFGAFNYVALGDVYNQPSAFYSNTTSGLGFIVSTFDEKNIDFSNAITVEGILQPGWTVELYRNGSLWRYQKSENGKYKFTDVPVNLGNNDIKLIFYGPYGATYEKNENYYITATSVQENEYRYRFVGIEPKRQVDGINESNVGIPTVPDYYFSFNQEYGITDSFSITNGILTSDTVNTSDISNTELEPITPFSSITTIGIKGSILGFAVSLNEAFGIRGTTGNGTAFTAQGTLLYGSGLFTYKNYNDLYINDAYYYGKYVENYYELRYNFSPEIAGKAFSIYLNGNYGTSYNDERFSQMVGRVSGQAWRINWSVEDTYQIDYTDQISNLITGVLANQNQILSIRGEAGYDKRYGALDRATLTLTKNITDALYVDVTGTRSFGKDNVRATNQIQLATAYTLSAISLGLTATTDGIDAHSLSFSIITGIIPDTTNEELVFVNKNVAYSSIVVARVFLDSNGNGEYDDGEKLLPNIPVNVSLSGQTKKTNSEGYATFLAIEPYKQFEVSIDESSLPSISYMKEKSTILGLGSPGSTLDINIPIVETSNISGFVKQNNQSVSGIIIYLVNKQGKKIESLITNADGYYQFTQVPIGEYEIVTDTDQLNELSMKVLTPVETIKLNNKEFNNNAQVINLS